MDLQTQFVGSGLGIGSSSKKKGRTGKKNYSLSFKEKAGFEVGNKSGKHQQPSSKQRRVKQALAGTLTAFLLLPALMRQDGIPITNTGAGTQLLPSHKHLLHQKPTYLRPQNRNRRSQYQNLAYMKYNVLNGLNQNSNNSNNVHTHSKAYTNTQNQLRRKSDILFNTGPVTQFIGVFPSSSPQNTIFTQEIKKVLKEIQDGAFMNLRARILSISSSLSTHEKLQVAGQLRKLAVSTMNTNKNTGNNYNTQSFNCFNAATGPFIMIFRCGEYSHTLYLKDMRHNAISPAAIGHDTLLRYAKRNGRYRYLLQNRKC
jgi:hypothetical protein